MNEEPFGPVAIDHAFTRLRGRGRARPTACPTGSPPMPIRARPRPPPRSATAIESGMVSINHHGARAARDAVRRRQGFRLRQRRRCRSARGLSQHQVHYPGGRVRWACKGAASRSGSKTRLSLRTPAVRADRNPNILRGFPSASQRLLAARASPPRASLGARNGATSGRLPGARAQNLCEPAMTCEHD